MKKVAKNFWEKILPYPSFNKRFQTVLIGILVILSVITYIIFLATKPSDLSEKVAILNLMIQAATLLLGIFAAYYALRQLVETRFISLDEAAAQALHRHHYVHAGKKWVEAFYIRPDPRIFTNLCEALLLTGDYEKFDQYMYMSEKTDSLSKDIFHESSDKIILLYLKITRHLLVKNQGEAENYIRELILLVTAEGLVGLEWNFMDLQVSEKYQNLTGECKDILDNLITYLTKVIIPARKLEFESGLFATRAEPATEETHPSRPDTP